MSENLGQTLETETQCQATSFHEIFGAMLMVVNGTNLHFFTIIYAKRGRGDASGGLCIESDSDERASGKRLSTADACPQILNRHMIGITVHRSDSFHSHHSTY